MGLGGTLRRLRADPVVALGTFFAVSLSLVLLAAGPIYSDAVAVGALRRSLADEPATNTAVAIDARADQGDVAAVESVAFDAVSTAFGPLDHDLFASLLSTESFELPEQPDVERVDLATFAWLGGVGDHVSLVTGDLPGDAADGVEVAVDAQAAETLGLGVGQRLEVIPRSASTGGIELQIVGLYEVVDPSDGFWIGRERLAEPLSVSSAFRTVTLLTARESMLAELSRRPQIGVLAVPRFDQIVLDDLEPLRRRLSSLEASATDGLRRSDVATTTEFEVETTLSALLSGRGRTLTVARSVVSAVVLQLAVLGAFALVLVAGLAVDARHAESTMLRARGASGAQLVVQAMFDAAVIVVPVAAVAPLAAVHLVGALDDVGPLASNGLTIAPAPVAGAWITVAVAALGTLVLLTWPAVRAARALDASLAATSRRRLAGVVQRFGIDLAVLAIAAASYWQLRTLGDERAATIRGRFGVDPLLVAAPAFGLVAGAFLALRLIPTAARFAELLIGRTRGAPIALTGWQLARRPHRYSRAALLVIMAIAIGTFAVSYEATWSRSQSAQASHELGADGRLVPNRRTGDSIDALQLPSAIERIDGVRAARAVVSEPAGLPATDRPGRVVAIDAARSGDVFNEESRLRPGVVGALAALAEQRPEFAGLALPGRPVAIEIPFEALGKPVEAPIVDDDADVGDADNGDGDHDGAVGSDHGDVPYAASVTVVVRDGDDMLHQIRAGSVGAGRSVAVADITAAAAGHSATPRYPLSVVAIELSSAAQPPPSREYVVNVGPIAATGSDGSRTRVQLVDTELALRADVLGFLEERTSLVFADVAPAGGVSLAVGTGSSFTPVPVLHTLEIGGGTAPTILPAVGTAEWLAASDTKIGDVIAVSLGRVEDLRVQIVGVVDAVPTVDPATTDALLVDLPSLLAVEQRPGQPTRTISEYWFAADPGVDADALTRPPLEAVEVELLLDRERELSSNPGAIGAIGAFLLGFGAAATFAVAGFVVTVMVSMRDRRAEFAILRALGLSPAEHRRWMMLEQAVLVVAGAALGTLLGIALAHLVLPVVSLSQGGSRVFPAVTVIVPWRQVAMLDFVTVGGLVAGILGAELLRGSGWVGAAVRAGGDR